MMMELTLSRYAAPLAELLLVTDGEARLRALDFADYEERMRRLLARHYGVVTLVEGTAPAAITGALDGYFGGDLQALDAVPLAARLGKPGAARAVGLANGLNPIGIVVPCHRVIGASGALTGYAGGVERKRWLLAHEAKASREQAVAAPRRSIPKA